MTRRGHDAAPARFAIIVTGCTNGGIHSRYATVADAQAELKLLLTFKVLAKLIDLQSHATIEPDIGQEPPR
jgi:hypothetical protein